MPSDLLNSVSMYARIHRQGYLWEGVLYGFEKQKVYEFCLKNPEDIQNIPSYILHYSLVCDVWAKQTKWV